MAPSVVVPLLCVVVAALCQTCACYLCSPHTFHKLLQLDDLAVPRDQIAEVKVRSKLDCGQQCDGAEGCVMFTFLPNQNAGSGTCRLHGQLPNSTVGQEDSPGARSYAMQEQSDDAVQCDVIQGDLKTYDYGQEWCHCPKDLCWQGDEANGLSHNTGFGLPRAPDKGWAVCIKGTPVGSNRYFLRTITPRIFVTFKGGEGMQLLVSHLGLRMGSQYGSEFEQSVVVNEGETDGSGEMQYGQQDAYTPRPYPFVVGNNFTLKIVATEMNVLKYFGYTKELATRTIQSSISELKRIWVRGDVYVSYVNIWCTGPVC